MADTIKQGYGQIEPNRCSFLHDGNIESQCVATEPLENGQIVKVVKEATQVTSVTDFKSGVLGLNYTAEKIYDERTPGRKNFRVEAGQCPRVGYLKTGDVFTTNVMFGDAKEMTTVITGVTDVASLATKVSTGLYWTEPTKLSTTAVTANKLQLQVVEVTDTADGQVACKVQVL